MQEVEHTDRNGRPRLSQSNFRVPSSRSAYGSTPGWVEKATKDFLDDAGDTEPSFGIKQIPYTRPQLRETIKRRIMAGSDGGRPGQWSARKAQLVAQAYRRAGGGYRGKPGRTQRSLKKWTSERWTTSDGKPARRKGGMTRYLPAAAWKRLTPSQRRATIAKKLAGDKTGKQFVANTQRAANASKKTRSKTLGPSVQEVANNPDAPKVFSDTSSEKDRMVSTEPLEQAFSPNKEKLNEITNAPSYGGDPPVKPFIPGNLDIDNREPIEKQNGSLALIEPIIIDGSGDEAGMFIIVPLITKFGQTIEQSNASSYFSKNGEHLGKFKSREDAEQYLEWLKDIEEEISYRDKKKPIISMHPIEKIAELAGDGFESRRQSIKNTIKRIADKYMTEKALGPALRAINSVQIYDPDAIDADNDGLVQDATPWMRPSLPSSPIIAGLRSVGKSNIASQRAVKEAQEFMKFVSQHEPELTQMMKGLADKKGSSLYLRGLKNRQKPVESLALKAQRLQNLFDGDLTDSITSMNDPLRYTFESDDVNKYTNDVLGVISALAKKGHNASVTNYWTSGDPYKGINVMVDHPDGFFYEIQFHTPSSYRLKNKLTPLYEKYRDEKNVKKRQEIYDEMLKLSKGVSIPKEIGKFGEPLSRGSGQAGFKPARPGKLIPTPLGLSSTSRINFIKEETTRQEKLLDKITNRQFKEKWGPLFDILDMNLELSDSEIRLKDKKGNNLLSQAGLNDLNKVFMYKRDKIRENPLNYDSPELERIIDAIDKFALDDEKKEFVLNQAREMLRLRKLFENTGRIKGANKRPMNRDFISAREFVKVPYRGAWIYPDGEIYPVFWHGDEHNYINSFKDGILRLDTARVTIQGEGAHLNLDAKIEKLTPSQIETVVELYEGFGRPKLVWEIQGHFFRFDEDGEIKKQSKDARQKILRESLDNDIYTNLTSVGGMSSRRRDMTDSEKERFRPIELAPDEKIKLQPGTTLVYADEDDRIIRTELIGPQLVRVRGISGIKLYTDPSPDNQNAVDAQMREWDELYGPVSSPQRQARGRGGQPDRTAREQSRPRVTNEDPIDRILRETEEARGRRGMSSRTDTYPILDGRDFEEILDELELNETEKDAARQALLQIYEDENNSTFATRQKTIDKIKNLLSDNPTTPIDEKTKEAIKSISIKVSSNGIPVIFAQPHPTISSILPNRDWSEIEAPSVEYLASILPQLKYKIKSPKDTSYTNQFRVGRDHRATEEAREKFEKQFRDIIRKLQGHDLSEKYQEYKNLDGSWVQQYVGLLLNPARGSAIPDIEHDILGHFGTGRGFDRHGEWANAMAITSFILDSDLLDLTEEERDAMALYWLGEYGIPQIFKQTYPERETSEELQGVVDLLGKIRFGEFNHAFDGSTRELIALLDAENTSREGVRSTSTRSIKLTEVSPELLLRAEKEASKDRYEFVLKSTLENLSSRPDKNKIISGMSSRTRLTDEQKQQMLEMLADGAGNSEIMKKLGVTMGAVRQFRIKNNIPPTGNNRLTDEQIQQIFEMLAYGMSDIQIAEKLGVTRGAIRNHRINNNIPSNLKAGQAATGKWGKAGIPASVVARNKKIIALHKLGKVDTEIARELGIGKTTVREIRVEAGLTRNDYRKWNSPSQLGRERSQNENMSQTREQIGKNKKSI